MESNLVILVFRLLTTYIKGLPFLSKVVPRHNYCAQVLKYKSSKSEVAVVDVLMKNEAYGPDMIDIMQSLHSYLGGNYPSEKQVTLGRDQLTCEQQAAAQ